MYGTATNLCIVAGAVLLSSCHAHVAPASLAPNGFSDASSRCAYSDFGFASGRIDAGGSAAYTVGQARELRSILRGPVIVVAFGDHPEDFPARPTDQRLAETRKSFVVGVLNAAGIGISAAYAIAGRAPGMRSDHSTAMIFFDCRSPS